MKKIFILISLLFSGSLYAQKGVPVGIDSDSLFNQMDYERLVAAYGDLHPDAAFMALWNSYFKEGSTKQNVGIMETSVDSRHNVLTANSETLYAVHPVNLNKQQG
ncbi:hypothetical protein [Flammeovirga kamogawensis]|uniref:Uncharacterized protein n=1 Tax=Flammeovirga kamogawensis TaxID=373891 RepID=A0ABX8GYS9_9BACT|nr:hypothetical protein [Flammeovirga kamogawensis]MBB6462866.1 hypothetical protein [Flammeovirga kamogawensis]QWG08352.1 hypothetical protein KM029_05300 [Flammeovirga kamogawensis]TRX66649.1 hypothetical protein EO216_00360 [Flammeovirga kamogawensis]